MAINIQPTDYTGMDAQRLQFSKQTLLQTKSLCEYEIQRAQETIKECKALIKVNEKQLLQIQAELLEVQEAEKHTSEVAYEPIIYVKKHTESSYTGYGTPAYYSRSMWQDYVVYYFEVYNVNTLGWDKGFRCVDHSETFVASEKTAFNAKLLEAMRDYNIHKLRLAKGVKVNTTLLMKQIPDLTVEVDN